MPGSFDPWSVLLSFTIASLAGFVAFESVDHTRYSARPALWTLIGGVTLGLGIWSMHFIGMMAWEPPFPLYYAIVPTLISVLVAVLASWLAIHLTVHSYAGTPYRNLIAGAVVVGIGIGAMHYIGMNALKFSQPVMWNWPGVALSFVLAVLASLGAMAMLQRSGDDNFSFRWQVFGSLIIGVAICGMHYTGMLAMMLPAGAVSLRQPYDFSGAMLARLGVANVIIFMACLLVVFHYNKMRLMAQASEAKLQMKEAERSSERLETAGKIASSFSHQIRNPLETVTNLLYLAENGDVGENERAYIRSAQEEVRRIAEITTLKFYRSGGISEKMSLPELFESALAVFDQKLRAAGIHVEKQWSPDTPQIVGRPGEIRQVFANLISNSVDSMQNGGLLWLAVSPDEDGVVIEVADSGTGIPGEIRDRILEPFFTTKGNAGAGLGLTLCAEIVRRHNGIMHFVTSTEAGRSGTRFILHLPLVAPSAETPERYEEQQPTAAAAM